VAGKFITVEGIEGVGKSTNIDFLSGILEDNGIDVMRTREPGGTPMAERIREMLLEHGKEQLPDIAESLLFFASRSLHITNAIRPALAAGQWVVCDRFTDASRAYQGYGRGLGVERINLMAEWVHEGLQPDLTLLLDAPAEVGMARAQKRGAADRLDSEEASFYRRVRDGYLELAAADPGRFAIIDASQDIAAVRAAIAVEIKRLLSNNQD
jgi:dTMP kinase